MTDTPAPISIKEQFDAFNTKLANLTKVLKEVFKVKNDFFKLTIAHCVFKDENVIVVHPDIPTQEFLVANLDNLESLKASILTNIEDAKNKKHITDLKWQIDYWTKQTSPEFIAKMIQKVEDMRNELKSLTQE